MLSLLLLCFGVSHSLPARSNSQLKLLSVCPVIANFSGRDSLLKTRQEFLDQYGSDDSSRALIRFYYYRQKNYGKKKIFFYVLSAFALFVLYVAIRESREKSQPGVLNEAQGGSAAFSTLSLAGAAALGMETFVSHSRFRRKLLNALNEYRRSGYINPRISYSLLFRLCLKGEPAEQFRLYKKAIRQSRQEKRLR